MEKLESMALKEGTSWVGEAHDILRSFEELNNKNRKLEEKNQRLENNLKEIGELLVRCPITGLYNFEYFRDYLTRKLALIKGKTKSALIIINIDNMAKVRFAYGDNEVDEVLKNTVYLIEDVKNNDKSMLFRLQGAAFAWYCPDMTNESAMEKAEKVRNLVSTSHNYLEKVTLSIGVVFLDETISHGRLTKNPFEAIYELAMQRVKLASESGQNIVCGSSVIEEYRDNPGKILIVDIDEVSLDVLTTVFKNLKYEVLIAGDGEAALKMAKSELPDVIISEIMLPKTDAFMVREGLLMDSETKDIPFIVASHLKNEASVERALGLGIEHYLKKPFMLLELIGITKLKIKGETY